tara:strand:+ start:12863 stop:15358 length:2496 start_codon:yes stop_codon:yes gene_type:complete
MSIHVGGLSINQTLTGIRSQFIYDTKTDSDGGAWRHKCQHTSWYNETASANRSSRKEFPEVALLVTNQYNFYIYDLDNVKDGTTGELEVWMKFEGGDQSKFLWNNNTANLSVYDVTAKNGYIAIAVGNTASEAYTGYYFMNLVSEYGERMRSVTLYRTWNAGLAQRNVGTTVGWGEGSYVLPTANLGSASLATTNCTSVHMFAHRGNNIDPDTGTLVPSIAIGMGRPEQANTSGNPGGIYMIMGDGRRYNKVMAGNYCPYEGLCFNDYGDIVLVRDNYDYMVIEEAARSIASQNHPSGWSSKAFYRVDSGSRFPYPMVKRYQSNGNVFAPAGNLSTKGVCAVDNEVILWSNQTGITKWWTENHWGGTYHLGCYITSTFNTGWMFGKCIGMHLCSTNTNTLGSTGTQLATNHTFANNVNDWYGDSGASVTHSTDNGQDGSSGIARVTNGGGDNTFAIAQANVFTPEDRIGPTFIGGARYRVTFSVKPTFTGSYTLRVRAGGSSVQKSWTSGLTSGSWSSLDTGIITADGTILEIGSAGGGITAFDIDNIVVTPMSDTDKTVSNRELYLSGATGSITRTAVETGAELVGWGGFATTRYLKTDYTTYYNFGAKMTVMFWYRDWADSTSLMHLGPATTRNSKTSFHFYKDGGGDIRWTLSSNGSTEQIFEIELTENPVGWHHVCATLTTSGEVFLFHDGVERPKSSDSASSFTGTNIFSQATDQNGLNVGVGAVGGAFGGKIALLKLNAENLYPGEVLKIYTDELKMFQPNAKITLDGTDSEIKSMASDKVRKTYIAGTATHRSEFRGLTRINSVDTGVATLNTLTASDGIVAFE